MGTVKLLWFEKTEGTWRQRWVTVEVPSYSEVTCSWALGIIRKYSPDFSDPRIIFGESIDADEKQQSKVSQGTE